MKKNQVLNTLPLLQRRHSVEIITTTRGKKYEVTQPLRIRRWRFELASLRKGIGLYVANAPRIISLRKHKKYLKIQWISSQRMHRTLHRINTSKQHHITCSRRHKYSRKQTMKMNWRLRKNEVTFRAQITTARSCTRVCASLQPRRSH